MKFDKPALSQQKLIELMLHRGLPLADPKDLELARRALTRIGYFRLSGFMLPFMVGGGTANRHQFRPGTTIGKIVALHDFDAALRMLCLEGLSVLEVAIRASICDHLSRTYQAHWPLRAEPFAPGKHMANLSVLAQAVDFDLDMGRPYRNQKNYNQFIERYYSKYTDPRMPPGWMVRECASFRTWAYLYADLTAANQKQVSDAWTFPSGKRIDHSILKDWFHSLSVFRNRCAHHGRITHKTLPFPPNLAKDPSVAHLFTVTRTDLRSLIVVIAVLLKCAEPSSMWTRKLYTFLDWQTEIDLGSAAGFLGWGANSTWRDDPLWSL